MLHQAVDGSLTEIAQCLGDRGQPVISRSAAVAEYDLDGDLDLVVTTSNGRPYLLRNDGGNRQN